jgi:cytochrome b
MTFKTLATILAVAAAILVALYERRRGGRSTLTIGITVILVVIVAVAWSTRN